MSARRRTFSGRVARALTLAVALSAALASTLTATLAARAERAREDARLGGAAVTLQRELEASPARRPSDVADDEDAEVRPAGLRIALFDHGARLGGDPLIPDVSEGCATVTRSAVPWRRCAVTLGGRRVVVMSDLAPLDATRRALFTAALASSLAAALVALAFGRQLGARVTRPLERLRDAVAAVDPDAPSRGVPLAPEELDEIERLRATLSALLTRLDDALSQSRRFAADAAHELRTPLTTALGELELAERGGESSRDPIARARRTLGDMATLVERLLVLSMPFDAASAPREAVDLDDVVTEALETFEASQRARVEVAVERDAMVRGDPTLLRLMVSNAVGNALKFAPTGAVTVRVTREGGALVLRVSDDGPGIAREERERVFEAFYRSARARASSTRGHGVGLALVAHVARLHGATAVFEDAAKGAALRVTLPAWTAREGAGDTRGYPQSP